MTMLLRGPLALTGSQRVVADDVAPLPPVCVDALFIVPNLCF